MPSFRTLFPLLLLTLAVPTVGSAAGGLSPPAPPAADPPEHWAGQRPVGPTVRANPPNPIVASVRGRLKAGGLPPAAPATREQLIRRVTFDLIGLPPTPEEVDAFVKDAAPDA